MDGIERLREVHGGERVADVDAFHAVDGAQIAALDLGGFLAAEALEGVERPDLAGQDGAVLLDEGHGFCGIEHAAADAADADAPGVVGVVERGDLHLDGAFVQLRCGDVLEDGVEQGHDGFARILLEVADGPAVAPGGVQDGEVKLVV